MVQPKYNFMYYFIIDSDWERMFLDQKEKGFIADTVVFEHWKQSVLDVLPPGHPDPDRARHRK